MASGFTRGDRIPDFRRLNHAGEEQMLYDLQVGRPIALLLFNDPQATETRAVSNALNRTDPDWDQITRVAMVQGTPDQCSKLLNGPPTELTVLTDDGQVAVRLLGANPADASLITAFMLDANFRVIERLEHNRGEDPDGFLRKLGAVYQRETPSTPQVIRQQAPVLFIPRVMDDDTCRELIAFFESEGGQPSGTARIEGDKIVWQPDPSVKIRRDVYINEGPWLVRLEQLLARRVLPEIMRCFHFQVTQHEVFKLVCYDAQTGGYFRPHRDNESMDTQHRRFAMTLNLNSGDYAGGGLKFPEFGPDLYQPERGASLVFSSSLLHEVTPVTAGKRYVLLGFFFGKADRMQDMRY